jgi:hypothetical protein
LLKRSHNPKVTGSNPVPATNDNGRYFNRLKAVKLTALTAFCVSAEQLQDCRFKPATATQKCGKRKKDKKDQPIISMNKEEREKAWDEFYVKEERIVLDYDSDANTGKIRSLRDSNGYKIDSRELVRTKIELRPGDKVLFAPLCSSRGNECRRTSADRWSWSQGSKLCC